MTAPLSILILAAGEGTRMKSATPKVLHTLAGRSLLEHVLAVGKELKPQAMGVIVGPGRHHHVQETLRERGWAKLDFIVQDKPQGSGHAVLKAKAWLQRRRGTLLILYGDAPLLTVGTLRRLLAHHQSSNYAATFLAMDLVQPAGYGRMVLDAGGDLERIVEDRDATDGEKGITTVNSGIACWDIPALLEVLPELRPNNAKHEYYLTDAAALLRARDRRVGVLKAEDPSEAHGINTRVELARAERICQRRILEHWMREGVTIVNPDQTLIEWEVQLQPDCRLWPGTVIRGKSRIGTNCEIGPYTVIEDSIVKKGARVGPFAHLRAGTILEENVHIGNFVETKKTRVGKGSKANHLTYLGDARVGTSVNIGAGTITCNYDGVAKYPTTIDDRVFVGSNASLVAPVRLGRDAIVAAGSTITENVPPGALALGRARQMNKPGWAKAWQRKHKRAKD